MAFEVDRYPSGTPRKTVAKPRALFLDRDGTINVDLIGRYVTSPDEFQLIPGVGIALKRARKAGLKLAVITNQAGIAKGLIPQDALPLIHKRMQELIAREAGIREFHFDDIRICPHHPDDKCACRKPETDNLRASMNMLGVAPGNSFFVGDKISDLLCASRVGMRAILVLTGYGETTRQEVVDIPEAKPWAVAKDLGEAVDLILRFPSP